jgi:predicted DNA-binding protein with PD1-like motif
VKSRQLAADGEVTFVLVFEMGEEVVVSGLLGFAREQQLSAARFTAIGAFSDVVLGYFDWHEKEYLRIPVREQVEVLALTGDIALDGNQPTVHAHVVVGQRDGSNPRRPPARGAGAPNAGGDARRASR